MCNLYTLKPGAAEVAQYFRAKAPEGANVAEEVYPGYPGLVVREAGGGRVVQPMVWGFPLRLRGMKPASKPKPVNNIADLRKPMWVGLARKPQWRCLIPLSAFCEADGQAGAKTRTWFSLAERPLFAWAGLWRVSEEWGAVYSGVMTDCNEAIRPVHDRMPVLLHEDDHARWLGGDFDEALGIQARCFPDELIAMERTAEPWFKRSRPAAA
jgi:putative SOS response-associated peptidase YedK